MNGGIYVSDGGKLERIDAGRRPVTVAFMPAAFKIGPVAVMRNRDALSVAKNGTVFALDLGVTGIIRRISATGRASVVAAA